MISEKVSKAINDQIMLEEHSSRIYLSMASWCEVQGYPGAAAFLYKHSDEERMHQLKFLKYLNDRGGHAKLQKLEQPELEFGTVKALFDIVLKHEIHVTKSINNIVHLCMEERDYTTLNFLQWFVTEQIEEESLVKGVIDQLNLAGDAKGGLFHIDKELAAKAATPSGSGAA
ncbi:MAG: ferritin [Bacteroidales bacterium]|nr:ferritin [Bacteroidales bacterium]